MVCADGVTIDMCPCALLAANAAVCYCLTIYHLWCVSMWIPIIMDAFESLAGVLLYHYIFLLIILDRHGFCSTVLCLSDDPVFDCLYLSLICHCISIVYLCLLL